MHNTLKKHLFEEQKLIDVSEISEISQSRESFTSQQQINNYQVENTTRRDSLLEEDDSKYFSNVALEYDATWTLNDELRLQAVDALHFRTLEYHNIVHQKNRLIPVASTFHQASMSKFSFKTMKNLIPEDFNSPVCNYAINKSEKLLSSDKFDATSSELKYSNYFERMKGLKDKCSDNDVILWINILDISILDRLSECFNIHQLCVNAFKDLRTRVNITVTGTGTLISLCYFVMGKDGDKVFTSMLKSYVYISGNIIITFETELMCSLDDHRYLDGHHVSYATSIVMQRWAKMVTKACEIGPLYIFYELSTEMLYMQDPLLEFLSRSSFYFKKNMHLNMTHRQKVRFMKKIHTIDSSIQMIQTYFKNNKDVFNTLTISSSRKESKILQNTFKKYPSNKFLVLEEQSNELIHVVNEKIDDFASDPYLLDLLDSFSFMCECIEDERINVARLIDALDKINILRANNASVSL